MIFIILGKSATGKDSLYNEIIKNTAFGRIVPYTTRPMRKNETDGVEYNFVSDKEYEELKKKGLVIESRRYNTKHGIWTYFTVNENINPNLTYVTIGTLESFSFIRDYFKDQIKVVLIYIWLEDHDRLLRAIQREEKQGNSDYLELCRRYLADAEDFSDDKINRIVYDSDFNITYKNEKSIKEGADFIIEMIHRIYLKNQLSINSQAEYDSEVVSL